MTEFSSLMELVDLVKHTFIPASFIFSIKMRKKTVVIVAWTGIPSILLLGGTTFHSTFKLPVEVDSYSNCYLKNRDNKVNLCETDLMIWDEALLINRAVEMIEELLRDLSHNS